FPLVPARTLETSSCALIGLKPVTAMAPIAPALQMAMASSGLVVPGPCGASKIGYFKPNSAISVLARGVGMGAGPRVCADPSGESVTVPNAAPAAVPVRMKSRLVRRMLILPNRSRGLGQYIQMLLPIYFGSAYLRAMQVITILNRCRFSRFVYQHAQFSSDNKTSKSQCGRARAPPRSVRAVIGRR